MKLLKILPLCLICVLLAFLCLIGCNPKDVENVSEVIYPPTRWGQDEFRASMSRSYSLREAIEESDLVAVVVVENWLGESPEAYCSYFSARIAEQFTGESIDQIVLLQDGYSGATMNYYPLFTYGNKMLLFLKEAVGTDYENAYWIIGSYLTLFDVSEIDGELYLIDRIGVLSQSFTENEIAKSDAVSQDRIRTAMAQSDDAWGTDGIAYPPLSQAYLCSDIEKLIEEYKIQ